MLPGKLSKFQRSYCFNSDVKIRCLLLTCKYLYKFFIKNIKIIVNNL